MKDPKCRSSLRNFLHLVHHAGTSPQGIKCSAAKSHLLQYTSKWLHMRGCSGKLVPSAFPARSCHLPVSSSMEPVWHEDSTTTMSENSAFMEKATLLQRERNNKDHKTLKAFHRMCFSMLFNGIDAYLHTQAYSEEPQSASGSASNYRWGLTVWKTVHPLLIVKSAS